MRVISKEKSDNYGWSYLTRCGNENCDVVLELNPADVFAVETGYDYDFHSYEYDYYFRCPECGGKNRLSGWYLPNEVKEISKINRDPGFKKKSNVKVQVKRK